MLTKFIWYNENREIYLARLYKFNFKIQTMEKKEEKTTFTIYLLFMMLFGKTFLHTVYNWLLDFVLLAVFARLMYLVF